MTAPLDPENVTFLLTLDLDNLEALSEHDATRLAACTIPELQAADDLLDVDHEAEQGRADAARQAVALLAPWATPGGTAVDALAVMPQPIADRVRALLARAGLAETP